MTSAVTVALASLERLGDARIRDEMGPRYGIHVTKAFGVSMGDMKRLAKGLGRNHELALGLWMTGWYEARMLATLIDEPLRVSTAQMNRWCRDFDNWGICDTACFVLFDRTPLAWTRVAPWCRSRGEFERRAGFALLACLALHDKQAPNPPFLAGLHLVERYATDDRNFVKKGVSWALRAIGRRNVALRAEATAVATRLAASTEAAGRWVGKDALRDLKKKG